MYQIHGQWVNETDFSDYTFEDIKAQSQNSLVLEKRFMKEVDEREESVKKYNEFIDLYIKLYYEPLVEEYDEMKYFTKNHDEKMCKIINGKQIKSVTINPKK